MSVSLKRRNWEPDEYMVQDQIGGISNLETVVAERILADIPDVDFVAVTLHVEAHRYVKRGDPIDPIKPTEPTQ